MTLHIAGNLYDKYGSKQPVVRWLMRRFTAVMDELVDATSCRCIHDVGCGEGHWVLRWNERGFSARGSDVSEHIVMQARQRASVCGQSPSLFSLRDIYNLDERVDGAELVVCSEVLEHVAEPARALRSLGKCASRFLILSVPCEPLWRILNFVSGRYVRRWGNTPGHRNHWSPAAFRQFVSQDVDVVAVRRPLPWTVVLCQPRSEIRV